MIDFHVHLLPGMDDGSRNKRMSMAMLKESKRQGIEISVATPHFYFDSPAEKVIKKRERAYKELLKHYEKKGEDMPDIRLGFEVYLSDKIYDEEDIDRLCISKTATLLVEMPYKKWTDRIFDRLKFLVDKGYDIVIAHPERYIETADQKDYDKLFSFGVTGQVNAASFVSPITRDFAYKLIREGKIGLMGSDAHNTGRRANFTAIANEFISRNVGEQYIDMFNDNAERLLGIREI